MSFKPFLFQYILLILLLTLLSGDDEKTSVEIQNDIDLRNRELQTLRNEIKNIEESLIDKNKEVNEFRMTVDKAKLSNKNFTLVLIHT